MNVCIDFGGEEEKKLQVLNFSMLTPVLNSEKKTGEKYLGLGMERINSHRVQEEGN